MTEPATGHSKSISGGFRYVAAMAALFLIYNVSRVLYAAAGEAPAPVFGPVCYILLVTVVYFWFQRFTVQNGVELPFDMGWFLYLAWWAVVPVYLFKVRGVRGMWAILVFVGMYFGTYGLSLLLFYAVV